MKPSSATPFRQITILGPGLLGGSIGLAVRARKVARKVVVWGRRIEAAREAVRRRAADVAAETAVGAVRGSDLVILCVPVGAMPLLARTIRPGLKRGAIVTDVGSVKYDIVKQLTTLLAGRATFVGSHPMAGSEKDGLAAAKATLFEHAVCILTPLPRTRSPALRRLSDFWQALGCHLRTVSPSEHDELVAYISHVPHLTAAALVNQVANSKSAAFDFAGGGFRDMTRIASGPSEMWAEIVLSNREEIQRALDRLIEELETVRRHILNNADLDLLAYLRRARQLRDKLKHRF
jgi:prephenate dehydrogenase